MYRSLFISVYIDRVSGVGVGCLGWDFDLENKIKEGVIEEDLSLEEVIFKFFVKIEEFIV